MRYEADFESRLWFGQEVTTTVSLVRLGRSSMTFEFEVWGEPFEGRRRARAAVGRFVTVHVPTGADAAQPWPASWVSSLVRAQ